MDEDRLSDEHFLVDGVAPAVIGGDAPEPEYRDPPTAPIPVAALAKAPEKKSWLGRVFSPRSSR